MRCRMEIKRCTYKDAEKLAYLVAPDLQAIYGHAAPWAQEWQRLRNKIGNIKFFFERTIINNWSEVYLLYENGHTVGCCGISIVTEFEDYYAVGEIECNYIQRKYRNEAFSDQSLAFMENRLSELDYDKVCIWLLSNNEELQDFYVKHNYEPDGKMRDVLCNAWLKKCRYSKWLPKPTHGLKTSDAATAVKATAGIRDIFMSE